MTNTVISITVVCTMPCAFLAQSQNTLALGRPVYGHDGRISVDFLLKISVINAVVGALSKPKCK
jgi:hypothetical protein